MKRPNDTIYLHLLFSCLLSALVFSQTCTLTGCTTCNLAGTACLTCSSGYMLAVSGACQQCISPCDTCSTSTTYCDSCTNAAVIPSTGICPITTCNTALNQYFDGKTWSCLPCSTIIPSCTICSQYLTNATICLSCLTGNYLDRSLVLCLPCGNGCSYCNNGGTCGSCYPGLIFSNSLCFCTTPGQMYDSALKKCVTCTPGCLKCSGMTTCTTCDTANGWSLSGSICINCNSFCANCGPSGCITCQAGYQPVGGQCKTCALALPNPGCVQCSPTQCTTCLTIGYFMNTTTTLCQAIACNSSQTAVSGVCKSCSTLYDLQCTQCNITSCTFCTNGYVYNSATFKCDIRKVFGCGDGFWVDAVEKCDDWNFLNGDGCDQNCLPETDYVCNIADKQPIGTSLCKYTKSFSIVMDYIQKDPYSNAAHLFFTIEPAAFLQWTSKDIQDLMSPIQITDLSTGSVVFVSYNKVSFNFQRVDGINKFEVIIDSYQQNVENSYFKINLNFDRTSIPSIKSNAIPVASIVQLSSQNNGVPLYFYSEEIYSLQKTLQSLCTFIGYACLAFVFVGFVVPAGKLIVIQSLAVIQITFFSVLQFKNLPPTYIGFKKLAFSSGFNIASLGKSSTSNFQQSIYGLMGLSDNVLGNYNISFILLLLIPVILSGIGYFVSRHIMKNKLADNADIKEILMEIEKGQKVAINTEEEMLYKLRANIFKRILLEVSFYGLLLTGYLAWVSILKSFSSISASNILFSLVILAVWIAYAVIFIRTKTSKFNLNGQSSSKQPKQGEVSQEQNISILRFFGQFRSIYQQISKKTISQSHPVEKFYLVFMIQRLLVSVLIVLLAPLFSYVGVIILALYLVFFVILVFCHRRLQSIKEEQKVPLFKHLYQNYTLRQCINFITIIVIQLVFLIQQANYSSLTMEEAMATNEFTTKMAPILVLSFLMINLAFNIFLYVWQIKSSQLLTKGQKMLKILMYKKPEQVQKKIQKHAQKGEPYMFHTEENEQLKPRRNRQDEIDEIVRAHNMGGAGKLVSGGMNDKTNGYQKVGSNFQMIRDKSVGDEI